MVTQPSSNKLKKPIARSVIQKNVQDPLAELILSGAVKDGDAVPIHAGPLGLMIGEFAGAREAVPKNVKLN